MRKSAIAVQEISSGIAAAGDRGYNGLEFPPVSDRGYNAN